jgi:hypothetical protein
MQEQFVDQDVLSFTAEINACLVALASTCRSLRYTQLSNVQFVKKANEILDEIIFMSSDAGIPSAPSLLDAAETDHTELRINKAKLNVYETALETLHDLRRISLQSAVGVGETEHLRYALSASFQRIFDALSALCAQLNKE